MSFATVTNGTATALRGTTNEYAIANTFALPNIVGRDAPGKTGLLAKPALITSVGLYLASTNSSRRFLMGVWNNDGTGFVGNSTFITNNSNTIKGVSISRTVFAGNKYLIGGAVINPITPTAPDFNLGYQYGAIATGGTLFDSRNPRPDTNFVIAGSKTGGQVGYSYSYSVLPTEPLSPAATVGGPFDFDITVTWDAPSSDGGTAVTGYRIDRSPDGIVWTTIVADSASTIRTFTDLNLAPNTTFYYRVAAINAVATAHGADYSGPYSASVSATIPDAVAGNALSLLTATVDNPEPDPVAFTDFGPGIRFTSIDVQYGAEFLYNEITATTQDAFAELQTTDAPQSKALYGVRTYSLTNLLNSADLGAFEVAKDYLTYYYQPELRVQSITVDLANLTPEEKLKVLNLEIDSYISVSFTPNGIGEPKLASGLITGIAHRITLTTHEVELRLRNERNLFTTNSDSKGILNVNRLGP
jgi:hypothetical protein